MLATAVELIIDGVGEDVNGGRDVDDNMDGYGGQQRERGGHEQQTSDGVCRAPAANVKIVQGGGVEGNQGHGGTLHGEHFSGHGELACGERERVKQLSGQSDDQDVRVPRLGGDGDDGEPAHGEHKQPESQ